MTSIGTTRPHHGRKLEGTKSTVLLSFVAFTVVVVAINRSYVFARDSGLLDDTQSNGDPRRELRMSEIQPILQRPGEQNIDPYNLDDEPLRQAYPIDGDGALDRQDLMVSSALQHVQAVADADKALQWSTDPEQEAARAAALAEMMGLTFADGSTAPPDVSAVRARRSVDIVEAVRGCTTLECVRVANTRPLGPARFQFPHFMIIGWQKTATTSLHAYLLRHPQVARPWDKEPEFFTQTCDFRAPEGCPPDATEDYVRRVLRANRYTAYDGQMATYEASTHYSRTGDRVAKAVYEIMPWVKIVALLREPISRATSMLVHIIDKNVTNTAGPGGCLKQSNMDLGHCLLTFSQINGDFWGGPTNYSMPLKAWLDAFPSEQIFLGQFEMLTSEEGERKELSRVKKFLGLSPALPKAPYNKLGLSNSRKGRINPDGWPMKRQVYEKLVALVRPDCQAVADLVQTHKLGDGEAWMANWEAVWASNLNSCDDKGDCIIQLS